MVALSVPSSIITVTTTTPALSIVTLIRAGILLFFHFISHNNNSLNKDSPKIKITLDLATRIAAAVKMTVFISPLFQTKNARIKSIVVVTIKRPRSSTNEKHDNMHGRTTHRI
jgi:hypothetical protein